MSRKRKLKGHQYTVVDDPTEEACQPQRPASCQRSTLDSFLLARKKPANASNSVTAAANTADKTAQRQQAARGGLSLFSSTSLPAVTQASRTAPPAAQSEANRSSPPNEHQQPSQGGAQRWAEKHAPHSRADLVIASKKVQEVQAWLEASQANAVSTVGGHTLLLTGPSGSGKSTLVRVLAAELGCDVVEWKPPVPTSWSEFMQQGDRLLPYTSKLDEFESFTSRAKMPALTLQSSAPAAPAAQATSSQQSQGRLSQQPSTGQAQSEERGVRRGKVLLVDDLPHASNAEHRRRLSDALGDLVCSARFPTVITVTESTARMSADRGGSAMAGAWQGLHKDVADALTAAGCLHIGLNPITAAAMSKALQRIAAAEGLALAPAEAKRLGEEANGDLHNAIETLQLLLLGDTRRRLPDPPTKAVRRAKKAKASASGAAEAPPLASFAARDASLTLFHGLGKLLYNKREPWGPAAAQPAASQPAASQADAPAASACAEAAVAAHEPHVIDLTDSPRAEPVQGAWCLRSPMVYDPEAIVLQSGLDAGAAAGFLHENMPDFIADDGVQCLADALGYLSAADLLVAAQYRSLGASGGIEGEEYMAASIADAAASSVATRGLLFCNTLPAPRRWQPLRGPLWFTVHRAAAGNKAALDAALLKALQHGALAGVDLRMMATELVPYARGIAARCPQSPAAALLPRIWSQLWNNKVVEQQRQVDELTLAGFASLAVGDAGAAGLEDEIEES